MNWKELEKESGCQGVDFFVKSMRVLNINDKFQKVDESSKKQTAVH